MYDGDIVNPIGLAKTVDMATKGYNLIGSVYGELDLFKNLKFKSTFGLQANFWDSRTWAPKYKWDSSTKENSICSSNTTRILPGFGTIPSPTTSLSAKLMWWQWPVPVRRKTETIL
jgi:hypothetical protein